MSYILLIYWCLAWDLLTPEVRERGIFTVLETVDRLESSSCLLMVKYFLFLVSNMHICIPSYLLYNVFIIVDCATFSFMTVTCVLHRASSIAKA